VRRGDLLDGKYRIEERLGQGGMGAVYRATHLGTRRTVAVKVIHPRLSSDDEFVFRFRREAEAAGRLRHPNVVDVTDFRFAPTPAGRVAYLVMEYLDGGTLAEVLAGEARLSPGRTVDLLDQVCSAVDEAHRLGIVHRDLKPDNIWLEPNRRGGYTVKVLDFGLVKLDAAPFRRPAAPEPGRLGSEALDPHPDDGPDLTDSPTLVRPSRVEPHRSEQGPPPAPTEADEDLTRVGSLLGTPLYMSPEQCRGDAVDARSDIYSLGVIAYRMLTGEPPFAGTAEELLRLHTTGVPRPIRERARIPRGMARVVMAALARDPGERPQTAAGFASALRAGAEGSGTLLRQAMALYSERFPTFMKISLLGYAPLIPIVLLLYLTDAQAPWIRLSPALLGTIGPPLFVAMMVASFLAYGVVSALTVPAVVQSIAAPLRPLRLRTVLMALRNRWWSFGLASVAVMAIVAAGTVLLVVPGCVALVAYALYAPVAVMEGGGVRAILRRARRLARRSWSTVLAITVLGFALPVVVWTTSVDLSVSLKMDASFHPTSYGFSLSSSGNTVLYQLFNILVTPLVAIMAALLYMKTRQAGGEPAPEVLPSVAAPEGSRPRPARSSGPPPGSSG
jgi:serine/threonine protein kinase